MLRRTGRWGDRLRRNDAWLAGVQPGGFNTGSLVGSLEASLTKILPEQWNSDEIKSDGDHFVIVLNGKTLREARDSKHASGVVGFAMPKGQPD